VAFGSTTEALANGKAHDRNSHHERGWKAERDFSHGWGWDASVGFYEGPIWGRRGYCDEEPLFDARLFRCMTLA
jgi:hypothetical protein